MGYKITVTTRAQQDIDIALGFYADISTEVALKFLSQIEESYKYLETNPYFRVRYKNFRAITIKGFPFILLYVIDSPDEIIIYSCFHTSKSPGKYPK